MPKNNKKKQPKDIKDPTKLKVSNIIIIRRELI